MRTRILAVFISLFATSSSLVYAQIYKSDDELAPGIKLRRVTPLQMRILQDVHASHILVPAGRYIMDVGSALDGRHQAYVVDGPITKTRGDAASAMDGRKNTNTKQSVIMVPDECDSKHSLWLQNQCLRNHKHLAKPIANTRIDHYSFGYVKSQQPIANEYSVDQASIGDFERTLK